MAQIEGKKEMNYFINAQIVNMIAMTKTFAQACQIAARKDDGIISKDEEKQLKKIESTTKKFISELEAIK